MTCDTTRKSCEPNPVGGGGGSCTTDKDCTPGFYCNTTTHSCSQSWGCTTNADCGAGMICDARHTCVPGPTSCTGSTQCAPGCYCASGTCHETGLCTTDSDCTAYGAGFTCQNGTCAPGPSTQGCTANSQCATGELCHMGQCTKPACTGNSDCPAGQECVNATCLSRCFDNADCALCGATGTSCSMGYCS
jgi:Cys-rich repeat protein